MSNREEITKMVRGELTCAEAYELENRLHSRSERQIIEDCKCLELESLLNTRDCIESGMKIDPKLDNAEVRKSLGYLKQAIEEKTEYEDIKKYLLENKTTIEDMEGMYLNIPYIEIESDEYLIFTDGFLFPVKFNDKESKYIFNSERFFQLSDDEFEKLNENDIYYYALNFIENQAYNC